MASTSRQDAAFTAYLDLGPDRSLQRLHATLRADPAAHGFRRPPALRTLEQWSSDRGWPARIARIERQARADEERAHVERVRGYRERLRQEGMLLQQKGIAWLQTADGAKVGEAVRAIGEGFRLEALGLGEATDRVAFEATYDDTFERLTDDELERLITQLRATPPGGTDEPLAAESD